MKIRTRLVAAAALAAAGVASAQQFQVLEKRAYPAPPAPTSTTSTEFKPPANADPDPKSLAVPDDLQKQAKELVGKLSSPVYAEREKATRELAKMGRMALPALQEALGSATEPEVALRAEGLLPKAEADDMKARVGSFLADTDGKHQHTLPGWERFRAVCGNDKPSRKLFAEMLKSTLTHQMLLAADKTAEEVNGVLNQYVTRLFAQQNGGFRGGWGGGDFGGGVVPQQAKLPDMVAALFLESLFTDREVMVQASVPWGWGGQGNQSVTNYMYNVPEVSNALSNSGEYAGPIRKIIIQWMDSRETSQQAYQAWSFSNNIFGNDPKKRMKYACRVLEAEGGGPNGSNYRHSMLSSLASNQLADLKTIIPSIAKCFDDSLLLWSGQNGGNPQYDIQLRDYALAFALQVTDQKPEDYGMTRTTGYGTGNQLSNYQAFYFKDDNPPKNLGGGGGFRGGKGRFVEPVEEPVKKEEPKKEEPKEPKKEEPAKKVSQDDRRKIAFKKWDEWVKAGGLTEVKKDPKAEPKKDGSKPDEPKKDEPKKDLPQAQPAIQPLPAIKR